MKFIISFILLCVLLNIYLSNHNGVVDAASSITRERSEYIRKQLELRSQAVNDQITKFSNDINQVFEDKYGGLFFGLTTSMNTLSGLFGMLNLAIPCGGAAILSSAVLGMAQNMVAGSSQQDIGSTIANGVQKVIDGSIAKYNAEDLVARIESERTLIRKFYTDGVNTSTTGINIYDGAEDINEKFYENVAFFKKDTHQLETIGLYVLHANSHLLFLYDMITSGPELYGFDASQKTQFVKNFKDSLNEYRSYIDQVRDNGLSALNNKISDDGNTNQDEWNLRNDYYNYMKLYVYDISNYWDYLSEDFPNGMFIENAHISLTSLFGTPYNGDSHMNYNEINTFIESKNPYQYQGKFKGVYYKNYSCKFGSMTSNFNLVKYFGGRQNFFRDGVDRDTFYLGDEGSKAGPRQFVDLSGKSVKEVYQYLCRDGKPDTLSRDYHWGLNIDNAAIGSVTVSNSMNKLSFPEKSVASVLPISYNECNVKCTNQESTAYLVEGAVMGFVNSDITDDNIVFELTGSMIDAQKYYYLSSTSGVLYSRDGYKQYKHSMYFPADVKVTYKVNYNPYNRLPGNFKLYVDFKSTSGSINIQVHQSSSTIECIKQVINTNINIGSNGQLSYLSNIQLNPSNFDDNYITIQFSRGVYMNSLVFNALE